MLRTLKQRKLNWSFADYNPLSKNALRRSQTPLFFRYEKAARVDFL